MKKITHKHTHTTQNEHCSPKVSATVVTQSTEEDLTFLIFPARSMKYCSPVASGSLGKESMLSAANSAVAGG